MRRIFVPILLFACEGAPLENQRTEPCRGLDVTLLDSVAEPPANVSALMRVTDCAGEPLGARLDDRDFEIREEGALLSDLEATRMVWPAQRQIEGRMLIALDLSGSITRSGLRPLMIEAARTIAGGIDQDHRIAVFGFDGRPDLVPFTYFTSDDLELDAAFSAALTAPMVDDSTNLHGAVMSGLQILEHAVRIEEEDPSVVSHGTLVVFTDGADHAGYVDAETLRGALDVTGHSVFAVGIGPSIDHDALAAIGRTDFALATDRELEGAFAEVARRISARAAADYVVSYCTPARAGSRALEIRVSVDQLFGSAELDFDATGFGAGCSPEASPLK